MAAIDFFDEGQQYSDDDVLAAIAQKESGGQENAWDLTNQYGMRGPWQFSPDTYADVAKQHGLDGSDWSPENQIAIARAHVHDLRSKHGLEGTIQAWLGGEGNIGNEDFADGNGTTIREYTKDVMGNLMNMLGTKPDSISNDGSPYQTNLVGAFLKAGGKFDDPNEPLPTDFINRMMNQPTTNPDQRVLNDYLQRQAPEITAAAMGAHNRNQNFFNLINKMSADATRTGAGIDNKNMQKTMAAQFADQIAKSNSTANIAILAKLGAALTGVQFDPNSKKLADIGAMVGKQMTLNNSAYKAMQAQANKDRELELAKEKLAIIQNNGGSYSKGKGRSAGTAASQPVGYILETDDNIKNDRDKFLQDPYVRDNIATIQNGGSTPEQRNVALRNITQVGQNYLNNLYQRGAKGSYMEIANNVLPDLFLQNEEMSHPAGTNPADQEAQRQTVYNELGNGLWDVVIGYDNNGNPITNRSRYNALNNATAQVASGTLINP